jgi:hypothetical protein
MTLCISLTKLLVARDNIENDYCSNQSYFVITSPGIEVKKSVETSVAAYCSRALINPNDPLVAAMPFYRPHVDV